MSANGVSLKLTGLRKSWGAVEVLKGIDFEIEPGTFLSLLGPSGCGKSTALRLIAGLDEVSGGRIEIDGKDVTSLPPASRNIGMVFQNYALFPHMTVKENILYGMKVRRESKENQEKGLEKVADIMNLGVLMDRRPAQLSGGQQQRVALARVLISDRPLVLMDEPLSNLDAKLRTEIRSEIRELNRELGITIVYVTHDQSEALSMSDKVMLMGAGESLQFGSPQELFDTPANIQAARFVGTPPMNVISAKHLPRFVSSCCGSEDPSNVQLGIRPEKLTLVNAAGDTTFGARVVDCEFEGSETLVRLKTDFDEPITLALPSTNAPERGAGVHLGCQENDIRVFRSEDGSAIPSKRNSERLVKIAR